MILTLPETCGAVTELELLLLLLSVGGCVRKLKANEGELSLVSNLCCYYYYYVDSFVVNKNSADQENH